MRSLHADLTAAQKAASTEPYVPVIIENKVEAVRRLDFVQLDATATVAAKHDVAVGQDGSVNRFRMDGGTVKHQRVTTPDSGPWNSWNNLVAGMGSQVAAADNHHLGARIFVAYTSAGATGIRFRESTDNGATFSADALITTDAFPVTDLAVAYKNAGGDVAVAWIANNNLKIIIRTAGAWGAVQTWPHSAATLTGVAMAHGGDWDIVLTGTEITTTKPTLWTIIYGDGGLVTAGTWSSLWRQQQAESGLTTEFLAPFVDISDAFRLTYAENPTYTGGAVGVYTAYLHPLATFADGEYTWRTPTLVNAGTIIEGLAIASGADYVYRTHHGHVSRAPTATVQLDVTASVLSLELDESTRHARGVLVLNNDAGALAGPPAPIQVGNLVAVQFGYYTASGLRSSRVLDLHIAAYEHQRDGGISRLRIELESGWDRLRRSHQRTQIVHTTDHRRAILSRILSRAGLTMTTTGSSTRAGTVAPVFTIHPETSGYRAAMQVLEFLADRLIMRDDADALFTELSPIEASDYTIGTDHPLYALALRSEPPPAGEARAFGAAAFGQSVNTLWTVHGLAPVAQLRDLTSTTGGDAANTAVAHMRRHELDTKQGELRCPPVCGLEVMDVVTLNDALVASGNQLRRVMGIRWRFDRKRAVYEQQLRLGPR